MLDIPQQSGGSVEGVLLYYMQKPTSTNNSLRSSFDNNHADGRGVGSALGQLMDDDDGCLFDVLIM